MPSLVVVLFPLTVRVGRGIAEALLYSRNEAIIITEFLRRYFSDA